MEVKNAHERHRTPVPRPRGPPAHRKLERAVRGVLDALGLDLGDPNLSDTPGRVARAYGELFAGLHAPEPDLRTFPNTEGYSQVVAVTGIPFYSVCAHHLLPFFGTAHVGYVPGDRVVGLSKLARVVDHFARRPQIQERLTEEVIEVRPCVRALPVPRPARPSAPHRLRQRRWIGRARSSSRTTSATRCGA
jgi:GTP cyclohydrolase I